MKIVFAGGGTGGHFYPIIAVTEEINKIADKDKILENKLYFLSNSPYDGKALSENGIEFMPITAGKLRLYFSFQNFLDLFKTFFGTIGAILKLYSIFPDVVFSKGGYLSFPVVLSARILGIPVVIHESDSVPGRVNIWTGKFAKRIAISYQEAAKYFPREKTAWTGQPIRRDLKIPEKEGAFEYLKLDPGVPVIFILGGSQGADRLNNAIIDILPEILPKYQIIHQVGVKLLDEVNERLLVSLAKNEYKDRYHPFGFLNSLAMKMAAGASSLVISRAGSTIFEIASWQKPSIIVPIPESISRDQTKNALSYAGTGACIVIEETNLTPHILTAEINNIMENNTKRELMAKKAGEFAHPDSAEKIAREIINIAMSHDQ